MDIKYSILKNLGSHPQPSYHMYHDGVQIIWEATIFKHRQVTESIYIRINSVTLNTDQGDEIPKVFGNWYFGTNWN